jgi:zinc D-Ala-D-Ala carboxypeptidase
MDLKEKLSPNFTLGEMIKSETASRRGLDNTPGPAEIENLRALCQNVLQKVRDHYKKGIHVNSGFRHPDVNAAVGGSRTSDHTKGQAADIEIPGVANGDLAQWIADNCEFRQLILEFYTPGIPDSGWVHVSFVKGDNKKEVLTALKENGKTVYKPGLIK